MGVLRGIYLSFLSLDEKKIVQGQKNKCCKTLKYPRLEGPHLGQNEIYPFSRRLIKTLTYFI